MMEAMLYRGEGGSLLDAQAVIETSPLSRSQAEQTGRTANFLFPLRMEALSLREIAK